MPCVEKKICMTNIRKERGQTHYSHQTHHGGVRRDLFGDKGAGRMTHGGGYPA